MTIPELIADWPDVAALFDGPDRPWRATVPSWPRPWRQLWGDRARAFEEGGMGPREAEERAYEEARALRDNPRSLAGTVAGGGAIVKDAVARPRMVRRSRKAATGQAEMFAEATGDEGIDANPSGRTTYGGGM